MNQGDDIAGIVHAVGSNVTEFKPGDRVAALHEMITPGGGYAEYAVSPAHTTFHIPTKTTFEEAAAIPLTAITAALGLYMLLGLPEPWRPAEKKIPLVIYGASSAVGAYALQLAKKSGIHPLICIAGRSQGFVKQLLEESKGDVVIDYRLGQDVVAEKIREALGGEKLYYGYDVVCDKGSYQTICKVLEPDGNIMLVLPGKKYEEIPASVNKLVLNSSTAYTSNSDFAYVISRFFERGLQDGWFKAHPTEVVPGGLAGIQTALQNSKAGKASAIKYVFRIEDTEGVEKSNL